MQNVMGDLVSDMYPLMIRLCARPRLEAEALVREALFAALDGWDGQVEAARANVLERLVLALRELPDAPAPATTTLRREDRFVDGSRWPGSWVTPPEPVGIVATSATVQAVEAALAALPLQLRLLVLLRDAAGWTGDEVSRLSGLLPERQAELLRAGRDVIAAALDASAPQEAG